MGPATSVEQTRESPWYRLDAAEVCARLETDQASGLSPEEVAARLTKFGPNAIKSTRFRGPWKILAAQFADFMILVLIAAAVVSGILGDPEDTYAIGAIVVLNALIGFVQEYRAEQAIAALRKLAASQARVVRSNETSTIPATDLVPGDIVLLEAGNSVPADLRILESAQLRTDESALTGESHPVEKDARPVARTGDLPLGERSSVVYKGTAVTNGRARSVVVATGMRTELGKIAALLEEKDETKTPLQKRLAQFGRYLALVALAICAIVFAAGVSRGEPVLLMFLTAVSLAVAAIPEALPAVVTITLALGARKMLKVKALVRRLPAVETLGSVTYICSDKTGTLTQNRMQALEIVAGGEHWRRPFPETNGDAAREFLRGLALSNDAARSPQGDFTGDPTEIALLQAAQEAGFEKRELERQYPRVNELPFDSDRKRMTTVHADGAGFIAFTKGAPEAVLPLCADGLEDQDVMAAEVERMSDAGLRVLALAHRRSADPAVREDDLRFLGLVGLMDPPREEAQEAVAVCLHAGITPVMITGDHPGTARAIARQLGIISDGASVLTGSDLTHLDLEELRHRVRRVRVYARVDPAQKVALVEALQANGEFVAMTGDGVNDAPALKRADIGVAMGKGGTDVAREASDLVLLDDNFATIVAATREGRHIFDNIRKFVKYTMTSNSAEIWAIFLAPLLGMPVPLLPIHILWINLVTDGLPGLALAAEPAERNVMDRPPRPPGESLFAGGMWQHIVGIGLLMGGCSLFSQALGLRLGWVQWQTVVFTVLTMTQMAHVLAIRSDHDSIFTIGWFSNLPLLGAVLLTFGLQMAAIYAPLFQRVLKTTALSGEELLLAGALSAGVFLAVEIEKWMVRRGWIYGLRKSTQTR